MSEIAEISLEKYYGKGKSGHVEREGDLDTLLLQLIVTVNELVQEMNKGTYREFEVQHDASGKGVLVYKGKYKGAKS